MSKQNELAQLADAVTVDGSNVGIGTSSPSATLTASQSSNNIFALERTGISGSSGQFGINIESNSQTTVSYDDGAQLVFGTASSPSTHVGFTERMRLDSSGNLLVGTTDSTIYNQSSVEGMVYRAGNSLDVTRASNQPLILNRLTNNGTIADFRKNGSVVGTIGTDTTFGIFTIVGSNNSGLFFTSNAILPIGTTNAILDNSVDLGNANVRFNDIYATNGTIQTSDFNEKQDIATLTATEMLVGKRISALFKTFRWKDSVAEKGANARTHTGVIAQDVQAAFTAEGLDAGNYALFISSTWWEHDVDVPAVEAVAEVLDEDGNVTTEAVEAVDAYTRTDNYDTEAEAPEGATSKTRLGIRYPELLSFVAAYNEQRFASIEARLTALEA